MADGDKKIRKQALKDAKARLETEKQIANVSDRAHKSLLDYSQVKQQIRAIDKEILDLVESIKKAEGEEKKTLKQQLIKVENGIATNTFEIDSSFTSGYYSIKAYTNWMLNFKEQNHFVESLRIIDPKTETYIEKQLTDSYYVEDFIGGTVED
jgi:hypothetical protein